MPQTPSNVRPASLKRSTLCGLFASPLRRLYEEVGLGWVYALTKVPAVESLANK